MTAAPEVINRVMREDRGRLLAALIARLRDFQLAEDALQEAAMSAVTHWGRSGVPSSPQGWLLKVALRKAIDRLRAGAREARKVADMARLAGEEAGDMDPEVIPDERLSLIFTCCHPALEQKTQVALTLRTVCGLSTGEIARAFLDSETAMGQRLSRAKAKIAAAGIPFAVPGAEAWPARLEAVLTVVYLVFTTGHGGAQSARDLCGEAVFLGRLIDRLRPGLAEVEGCVALMLITHARAAARGKAGGESVALGDQDRALWDHAAIAEGVALLDAAMARRDPGPYQLKAAIAACHVQAAAPDWPQIAALYGALMRWEPTPIVVLNGAVALMEAGDLPGALRATEPLAGVLEAYQPFHAARAEMLRRGGDVAGALAAYAQAIDLASTLEDAAFLRKRRGLLLQ